jgi:hypothetical protein
MPVHFKGGRRAERRTKRSGVPGDVGTDCSGTELIIDMVRRAGCPGGDLRLDSTCHGLLAGVLTRKFPST